MIFCGKRWVWRVLVNVLAVIGSIVRQIQSFAQVQAHVGIRRPEWSRNLREGITQADRPKADDGPFFVPTRPVDPSGVMAFDRGKAVELREADESMLRNRVMSSRLRWDRVRLKQPPAFHMVQSGLPRLARSERRVARWSLSLRRCIREARSTRGM
jgi:hypothetical protein